MYFVCTWWSSYMKMSFCCLLPPSLPFFLFFFISFSLQLSDFLYPSIYLLLNLFFSSHIFICCYLSLSLLYISFCFIQVFILKVPYLFSSLHYSRSRGDESSGSSETGLQTRILSTFLNEMDGIGSTDLSEEGLSYLTFLFII